MIHLALLVASFLFLCFVGLMLLGLIMKAFEVNKGCGCFAMLIVVVGVLVVLAVWVL